MDIWIIDHYSVPVKYYSLARNTNFAKFLMRSGHCVKIFAASTVHNSALNLIEDKEKSIEVEEDGVKYVLINCHQYTGNGLKRIFNMYEFASKLRTVSSHYPKPDAVVSTSMTLFACKEGIKIGKKLGCKNVAQITDLWPESLTAYGMAAKNHPLVLYFRWIEKWIYKHSDRIIFSMEGAYDYIKEQGWEKEVPESKVFYVNNGVDLEQFDYNSEHYKIEDVDLDNECIFKVVYTGSVRRVNNLDKLLNVAKEIRDPDIKFLIWGDGEQLQILKDRVQNEEITNVVFKGRVDKKYIPYIIKKSDLNIAHNDASPIFRFGISFNKIFDYFAAGKPILCDFPSKYNPVIMLKAGISVDSGDEKDIAAAVENMKRTNDYPEYALNARKGAEQYDFKYLTNRLVEIIEQI